MPSFWIRFCALSALILAIATSLGCQRVKTAPPAPPPPVVTVAKVIAHPVQHYLEYNGFLDAVEMVQIRARVKGFLVKVNFKEGEEVKEKDLLYQIDDREYQAGVAKSKADIARANADIENSKAQIRLAEAELDRVKRAFSSGVGSKSDQDKAEAQLAANVAQLDTAKANVKAAEASLQMDSLNLEYTTILAPISGRISRTLVTKGNIVGQNELTLLTTIVRMDPLYVYFDTPERDLVEYQRTLKVNNSTKQKEPVVEVGVATEENHPHIGNIDFRENRVETGTGTIRIRGRIPNPPINGQDRLLYPGLYARVRIPVGDEDSRPVIPEDALMTGQEGRYVYVVDAEGKVHKRDVTVGPQVWFPPKQKDPNNPGWILFNPDPAQKDKPDSKTPVQSIVAIEDGLKVGERIIVNGLQRTRPEAVVSPVEWQLQEPSTPVKSK
jgi:multidrug efflux system membrane fusion protein